MAPVESRSRAMKLEDDMLQVKIDLGIIKQTMVTKKTCTAICANRRNGISAGPSLLLVLAER